MKKMKEKTARSLAAFLAAVCMFGTMLETALISRAEEGAAVSSETGNTDTGGQEEKKADSGADGQTGTQTPDGEKTGEGTEETKKAEDAEGSKDTVKPGDSAEPGDGEDIEDTEDTKEPGGEGTKDPEEKAPDSEDKEKEETAEPSPEGSTEEMEGEITETVSENTVETEPEESEEVGVMLLSAQAEETAAAQDADSTYTDENGVIYHYYGYEDGTAEIYELEDCKESTWDYKALNIPSQIGDYTVTSLTFSLPSETPTFPSVTIPETITYMKDSLFKRMKISELYYNAEAAETGAGGDSTGVFFQAYIWGLHIGGNVKAIPDYCFASSYMTMDELTIDVERIGEKAFDDNKTITTLTIGENVKEIGRYAFNSNDIDNINYNAVNAVSESYGGTVSGVFGYQTVSNITIGDRVTAIPEHLFCSIDYTADTLIFPDSLTTIGEMAFYGSNISIGELTIGENITSIGKNAFARGQIGTLHYNAVDARISGATESDRSDNCFELSEIGKLHIGERVKSLPDTLFCNVTLTQDTLKLPDSVTYIGAYVLSYSGGRTKIGTLEIGENVTHIGRAAFGVNTYDKVIVRAVEADTPPRSDMDIELPLCSSVEIHGKSPYYKYFTRRTDKDQITLLCEDFETTRGEEYYDAQKKSFVTPITDSCTVCGYEETSEEYSEAHTVIFTDYDGRELSRQHLHKGEDATAPEEPERTGYRFTGWDRSFTNVTSDLTVTAEYEIRKFSVVFKDGARIINEQEVAYGGDATAPGAPTRPEEEWGRWKFTGWSGSYTDVTGDRVITAQFEKVLNQYEVVFYDAEGNVLSRQTIAHGEDAKEPDAPEKEPTAQHRYVFTGWSAATEGITGNTAFYPVYDAKTRSYTVKFMDGSTVLDEQTVEYGGDATAPGAPTRPKEEWGIWRFTGWSGSYTDVTGDRIIRAQFEKVLNQYEVVFYDAEGNVLSRQTVAHGEDAKEPDAPEKEPTAQHRYFFTGWSAVTEGIIGDTAFYPVYETRTRTYTVTFMNGDISCDVQKVAYGLAAVTPADPVKEDETYTYRFVGWDKDYSYITGDLTVHAVFEQTAKPKDDPDKDKPDDGGKDKDKDKDKDKPKDDDSDGKKPGDGDGDGGQQPGGETGTEGGQPEGDPVGDAGEKNGDPSPETIAEKTILRREALPELTDGKKTVFPIPEIPDLSAQPEEKGVKAEKPEEQERMQTAESEETEGTNRQIPGGLWLLLLLGAGTGAWGIWLWLAGTDDRTICGTVMDEDGNAMSGVNVTLTGEEGKPVETQTDEDGQYLFEDLKKDSYRLCFHYIDATGLLLLDIHMERRDRKKVFSILKSAVNAVETKRSGGRYQIDVTV